MKKNYLFLGFAVPDEEMKEIFKKDKFPQIQTHKFNWNLIKGLETSGKIDFTYISAKPISDFPFYPEKKISGKNRLVNLLNKKIQIREIPYLNTSIFKIVTRLMSCFYYSLKDFNKIKNKGGIIVYSVHVPFMLVGYLMSKIYKIDYIAIWTDPPSVSHAREGGLKLKLRNIELRISKYLMAEADKVIALTEDLAKDFAPNKPYLVVEGIIDPKDINIDINIDRKLNKNKKSNIIKIVYTGSLEKKYGIQNIVEGFRLLEEKNVALELYGRGDYEEELKDICSKDLRVKYKGFVSNEEILKIQREADFLINARSADDEYVKYSFPSKTLEYMLSGTPLITTMLCGIPKEYEEYMIILKDNEYKTIKSILKKYIYLEEVEKNKIGLRAQKFAENKNYFQQGRKISDFITCVL